VPDLPGFGDSALPPGKQDADGVVPVLAAGLPELVGMRAVDVAGFSFGGLCGGLLAAAHPELVRHLVIVGAPGLGLRATRLPLVGWRHVDDPQARLAAHRANLGTLMLHRPASIDELAVALQAANVPLDRMRRRRLALTDILRRTLPAVQCRLDAIYGAQDALYADRLDELRALLQSVPALRELVLLPGAGHWAPYEDPAAFDAALLRLLDAPGAQS
jgi:2-hydroxy-6-oxonona-2,4-dienedioate hydrolase